MHTYTHTHARMQSGHVSARCGVAAALRALAPEMGPFEVPIAMDFLIGNGLADMSEKVGGCNLLSTWCGLCACMRV